jgi:hypothetical protein
MSEKNDKINRQPDWGKVHKDYKEWIPKVTVIPTLFYNVLFIISLIMSLMLISKYRMNIWLGISVCIFIISCYQLAKRDEHREGYIDGYASGYDQGRDDAFGITDEDRHFIDIESKL